MQRLDGCGMVRDCFEPETAFGDRPDFVGALVSAYDKAAERANSSARAAISVGGNKAMCAARWDEAVVATIERILCMLPRNNDEGDFAGDTAFESPERPDFET